MASAIGGAGGASQTHPNAASKALYDALQEHPCSLHFRVLPDPVRKQALILFLTRAPRTCAAPLPPQARSPAPPFFARRVALHPVLLTPFPPAPLVPSAPPFLCARILADSLFRLLRGGEEARVLGGHGARHHLWALHVGGHAT